MFTKGQEFRGYLVHKILGETALSVTFLAESPANEKLVVKVFKGERFALNGGFEHLKRARKAIADGAISSNIHLSFYTKAAMEEIAPGSINAYVVREYVEGEDLDAWRMQPRSFEEIKVLLGRICLGLDHLHKAGLIHGGLCPRNVILKGGKLKLTDFGTGSVFLGVLLGMDIDPESLHFLPPWRHDLEKFRSPATDIYALGVLLFLLQKGTFPEGLPCDSPAPVQKALGGEYHSIDEFWVDVEEMGADDTRGPEEREQEPAASEKKEGKKVSGIDEIPGVPEAAPNVEVTGEGIEKESSGLGYRLNMRLELKKKSKGVEKTSFLIRNLEQGGQDLKVRIAAGADCDWIRVEPAEVGVLSGEQRFDLSFGPFDSPGVKTGSVVLEISFVESTAWITRNITVIANVRPGILPEPPVEWRKWWKLSAALACIIVAAAGIFYYTSNHSPLREYREEATQDSPPAHSSLESQSSSVSPNSPPPSSHSPAPASPNLAAPTSLPPSASPSSSKISRISETLLMRGEFLSAREDLTKLWAANPGDHEVLALISKLTNELTIRAALIPSPGQGEKRHGDLAVISSEHGFRLEFTPSDNCYLYVYHIDSHKNVTQLFPNPEASEEGNPLQGGRTYGIPNDYFILDRNTGLETIFFVASRLPATDLEDCYARLAGASAGQQRDTYYNELVERIKVRRQAMDAGIKGCLFQEQVFWHGEG